MRFRHREYQAYRPYFRSIQVTGTNGKSTTTSMIAAIVQASGEPSARVTTLGGWVNEEQVADDVSSRSFLRTLDCAVSAGVRTIVIETTSQALADGFAHHWPADVAVFTNLSHDHLDVHKTFEAYLAAKAMLFTTLKASCTAVFNACSEASALLDEVTPAYVRRYYYAARELATLSEEMTSENVQWPPNLDAQTRSVTVRRDGTWIELELGILVDILGVRWRLPIVGAVHAENALAAALAAHAAGFSPTAIHRGLTSFKGVSGRFEVIHTEPLVVVDFAHTPDALERTLQTARALAQSTSGRLVCVFGCGGNRDPSKRYTMGTIAAKICDHVFLTSDNPRNESAELIAQEVRRGLADGPATFEQVPERELAIRRAVLWAAPADVVVIAGKGHEREQIIGPRTLAFSDQRVARDALSFRA